MTIRPATLDDVPQVLPMVGKTAAFHEGLDPVKYGYKPQPQEMYRDWLGRVTADERAVFLVADAAGRNESARLAGFIVGTIEKELRIYRLPEYGFIHDLWVEPDYRHEGTGKQLMMQAIERFTELGVRQVRLDVLIQNDAAKKLFASCGFRSSVEEMILETGVGGRHEGT